MLLLFAFNRKFNFVYCVRSKAKTREKSEYTFQHVERARTESIQSNKFNIFFLSCCFSIDSVCIFIVFSTGFFRRCSWFWMNAFQRLTNQLKNYFQLSCIHIEADDWGKGQRQNKKITSRTNEWQNQRNWFFSSQLHNNTSIGLHHADMQTKSIPLFNIAPTLPTDWTWAKHNNQIKSCIFLNVRFVVHIQ